MNKALNWYNKLTPKQKLIAEELTYASRSFVATVKPENDLDSSRRVAFQAGFYTALKTLGFEIPMNPDDQNEDDNEKH